MGKSMNGQLPMFEPMTSEGSPSATSSLVLGDGASRSGSLGGQTIDQSGQRRSLVSHTASLRSLMAARKVSAIHAICGRFSFPSSRSVALQASLESKCLARLRGDGGTEPGWTLRAKATPLRRAYSEL